MVQATLKFETEPQQCQAGNHNLRYGLSRAQLMLSSIAAEVQRNHNQQPRHKSHQYKNNPATIFLPVESDVEGKDSVNKPRTHTHTFGFCRWYTAASI